MNSMNGLNIKLERLQHLAETMEQANQPPPIIRCIWGHEAIDETSDPGVTVIKTQWGIAKVGCVMADEEDDE